MQIVKVLDVVDHGESCLVSGAEAGALDALAVQGRKEVLTHRSSK